VTAASRAATLTGLGAVALWSLLALLTAATGAVPPFQLAAMTFAIAGLLGLAVAAVRGRLDRVRPTAAGLGLGLYGIFGDTALYFAALKFAPPAEANLIHYLWPLLIVVFAALLPGGKLQLRHVVGALFGLAATLLLVGDGFRGAAGTVGRLSVRLCGRLRLVDLLGRLAPPRRGADRNRRGHLRGRRGPGRPRACLFETTAWPAGRPNGSRSRRSASARWAPPSSVGRRHEARRRLAARRRLLRGPVLSTLTLVAAGYTAPGAALWIACALIVAGALVATLPRPV
jgi:hypothetical protein